MNWRLQLLYTTSVFIISVYIKIYLLFLPSPYSPHRKTTWYGRKHEAYAMMTANNMRRTLSFFSWLVNPSRLFPSFTCLFRVPAIFMYKKLMIVSGVAYVSAKDIVLYMVLCSNCGHFSTQYRVLELCWSMLTPSNGSAWSNATIHMRHTTYRM